MDTLTALAVLIRHGRLNMVSMSYIEMDTEIIKGLKAGEYCINVLYRDGYKC